MLYISKFIFEVAKLWMTPPGRPKGVGINPSSRDEGQGYELRVPAAIIVIKSSLRRGRGHPESPPGIHMHDKP